MKTNAVPFGGNDDVVGVPRSGEACISGARSSWTTVVKPAQKFCAACHAHLVLERCARRESYLIVVWGAYVSVIVT